MYTKDEYERARLSFEQRHYEDALKFFNKYSSEDAIAQYYVALAIFKGWSVDKDENRATRMFKHILPLLEGMEDDKESEALRLLAKCYEYGYGVHSNLTKSFEYAYDAANIMDNPEAMCDLGWKYSHGIGCDTDNEQAFYWFDKAANTFNSPTAWCRVGYMYQFGNGTDINVPYSFECYTRSANLGHPGGQDRLGWMYKYGCECEKSLPLAYKWFKASADGGNSDGQYCLARLYLDGAGVDYDLDKAIYWLEKAVEMDNNYAEITLANIYMRDYKHPANQARARSLYRQASISNAKKALEGNSCAMRYLGNMYEYGEGVEKDYAKAIEWYEKAANDNEIFSMVNLANIYRYGKGVPRDCKKALELLNTAVEHGNSYALLEIGNMYENGEGVIESQKEAIKYWQRAADMSSGEACYKIGNAFLYGEGVLTDYNLAREWFEKATALGYNCKYSLELACKEANGAEDDSLKDYIQSVANAKLTHEELFNRIDKDLAHDFGEYWDVLQPRTRIFLSTGMSVFYDLYMMGASVYTKIDFSSAITPMVKALEYELNKYLFTDYVAYLEKTNVPASAFSPTQMFIEFDSQGQQHYAVGKGNHRMTLGSLGTCFGMRYDMFDTDNTSKARHKIHDKNGTKLIVTMDSKFLEYANLLFKMDAFSQIDRQQEIAEYLRELAQETSAIAKTLRNRAVHDSVMKLAEAEHCVEWLVKVKKLILDFISKINL